MFFQVISRKNDPNGNPFRLMLCYNSEGQLFAAYEARSSMPNKVTELRKTMKQLPSFFVSPMDYKATKQSLNVDVERVD